MSKPNVIDSFQGDFFFLSNFYRSDVEYEGLTYPSVENAFQSAKTYDFNFRRSLSNDREGGEPLPPSMAKKLGRQVQLRADWELVKDDIMYELLKNKFSRAPLREMLLATNDNELIEGNAWNDIYWGQIKNIAGEWIGQNKLGQLIQKVRAELRGEISE